MRCAQATCQQPCPADIGSVRWPASGWNAGRHHVGTVAGFRLESVADFVGIHTLMGHERRTMTLNLTYDELAERLGTTRNAARVLAQRRKWARYTSQEDGKARVRVPEDELDRLEARRGGDSAEHELPHDVPPASGEVEALKAHVQTLKEQLAERSSIHAAE